MADATTQNFFRIEAGDPRTDPSTKSSDYQAMEPFWFMVDTILAGVEAMRAQGERYLPRYQEEHRTTDTAGKSYDPYELRKAKAPLENIYEDILHNLASKPFAEECVMKEDTPDQYKTLAQNIDAQGRSLHVFASEVFKAAVNHSISWILVEFTRAKSRPDGLPLTKLDEQQQNLRPYWCHIPATRLLAVYSDFENGKEIITHARIFEPAQSLSGFLEQQVLRVRVLDRVPNAFDEAGKAIGWGPPMFFVWEQVIGTAQGTPVVWQLVDFGDYKGMDVIPLVPIITGDRTYGSYQIAPPLRGIAHMQIDEYQQESNLQWITDMTCFPMLAGNGVAPPAAGATKVAIGPRTILFAPPPLGGGTPGKWEWIEPSAESVKVVADKLERTRTEMRDLGMQPLTQSNLTVITTGQVATKANSAVEAWAINLEDGLERAMKLTAQWMGDQKFEPEVIVFKDFDLLLDDGKGFEGVMALRKNKDVSREAAINSAIRYGYLPKDFDIKADDEKLAEEQQGLQGEVQIDPLTGRPLPPNANAKPPPNNNQPPQPPNNGGRPPTLQ